MEPPTGSKMIQLTCQVMIDGTGNKQLKDLPDPPAGQGDLKIFTGDTAFLHLLLGRSFHRSIQSLANSEDSKVAAKRCPKLFPLAVLPVLLARQMTGRSALNCIAKALGKRGNVFW